MGTGQHNVPLAAGLRHDHRRAMLVALACLVAVLLAITVTQVVGGDDTTAPTAVQPAAEIAPAAITPGLRYDGGPEEGSRGLGDLTAPNPGRPDGGPEEGTRGPGH